MPNQHTKPIPLEERFWTKVDKSGPNKCWLWLGRKDGRGYGLFSLKGNPSKKVLAHRLAFILINGPIPNETLDHLCRNRACVNPVHLEPVTLQVNILRGNGLAAQAARRTHCPKGHPFDLFNTHFSNGQRRCRICDASRQRTVKVLQGEKP